MKLETKYKGSLKLSAIGDALGWITEFEKSVQSIKDRFGTERIDEFYSWKKNVGGRFYGYVDTIRAGSYSDDTQLMLSVARSIKKYGRVDHQYFAKIELANWLDYARGGGKTVKIAARRIQRKSASWSNNFYSFKNKEEIIDYRQCGANGAAMRILPIALVYRDDFEKIKEEIFCNSIVTHGHPRAILGAMLYGYAINQIIVFRPEDFSWENYITRIGVDFPKKFELSFSNKIEIQKWLKEWNKASELSFQEIYAETVIEAQSQLRLIYQSIRQKTSTEETLRKLGCFSPTTKGSGIATVIAGIYLASKFHNNPLEAMIEAVNAFGSDTDSIAAFTGGLIGALYGQSIIPEKWHSVQDVDYLDKIAERLLMISENQFNEKDHILISKNVRNINVLFKDNFTIGEEVEFTPLGIGCILSIDRQLTLTKGKYNLLLEILFEGGQSVLISRIFNTDNYSENYPYN